MVLDFPVDAQAALFAGEAGPSRPAALRLLYMVEMALHLPG